MSSLAVSAPNESKIELVEAIFGEVICPAPTELLNRFMWGGEPMPILFAARFPVTVMRPESASSVLVVREPTLSVAPRNDPSMNTESALTSPAKLVLPDITILEDV